MTDGDLKRFIDKRRQILGRRRCWARMAGGSVVIMLVTAAGVFAFFSSQGHGSADASVGVLNPPTNVTAKAANGSTSLGASPVVITWDAPTTGVTPTGYQVKRGSTLL